MPTDRDDLQGFGADARRAVASAAVEARALGHDRVGTEHLLLGLLCGDTGGDTRAETSSAARVLKEAGATLSAARHKVREAVGTAASSPPGDGALPSTPRASRALGRAVRFSHNRRSAVVTSEHLLEGVLDVEGTAGQVLRGLGVDVDRLRAALDPSAPDAPDEPTAPPVPAAATCPSCNSRLDGNLAHRTMAARSPGRSVDALVFSCATCGHTLGVAPA